MSRQLKAGERVLLLDSKRRRYLITLADDGEFHSHAGVLPHTDLIGQAEGVTVKSTLGARYTAVRPTLSEYVLEMPRGAQVIYPKDLGPILLLADIYPGARVLEGRFMSVQQAIGVPKSRTAAVRYLESFVAEITTSGLLRDLIARHRIEGLSIVRR